MNANVLSIFGNLIRINLFSRFFFKQKLSIREISNYFSPLIINLIIIQLNIDEYYLMLLKVDN